MFRFSLFYFQALILPLISKSLALSADGRKSEGEFFADFLTSRLQAYQISVFSPDNVSMAWAMTTFTERCQNQIAFNILKRNFSEEDYSSDEEDRPDPTYEDLSNLEPPKRAFLFIPQTIPQAEYYLRLTLNWAYRAPRTDDRLNKMVIFFLLRPQGQSLSHLAQLLQILTFKYSRAISDTEYLYPTAMDGFYIINGTDLNEHFFEIYTMGRRASAVFHVEHIPEEKLGLFTIRRFNFRGTVLAVATVKSSYNKDVITAWDSRANQTILVGGLSSDIMTCLQQMLNFSMKVTIYKKGWNEELENITLQGMGWVLFQEIEDIFIIKSTYMVKLAWDFKLLVPHHIQGLYAFFIQPSIGSGTNLFWKCFQPTCWIALGIILFLLCGSKFLMDTMLKPLQTNVTSGESVFTLFMDELMWLVALVSQQGWTQVATAGPLRLVFLISSLMSLLCLVALTAQLTSALSVNTAPIKTFFELIRTNLLIAVDKDSQIARDTVMGDRGYFLYDEVNTGILNRKRDRYVDMVEGARLVIEETHSFLGHGETKSILISDYNKTGEDFCSISGVSALQVHKIPFRSGMIATQNFPYKEFFNVKLVLLNQIGLTKRFNRYFAKEYSNVDCHYFENEGKLMEWQDLSFAYGILILGHIFAGILCLFERQFHQRKAALFNHNVHIYS